MDMKANVQTIHTINFAIRADDKRSWVHKLTYSYQS